jgi:Xaa-Pro aminopeptidase
MYIQVLFKAHKLIDYMKPFTKKLFIAAISCISILQAFAQTAQNLPKDYLSPAFHAGRRQALRNMMAPNSVAVIFAYPERVFSNDVNYVYHANPDMYYFSGYKEPDGVLLIFKDIQGNGDSSYNEILFVRKRDAAREQWTGRRLGVEGAKTQLGFKKVYNSEDFFEFILGVKLDKYSEVLYDEMPDETGDKEVGSLRTMVKVFKSIANIKDIDPKLKTFFTLLTQQNAAALPRITNFLTPRLQQPPYRDNEIINQLVTRPDSVNFEAVKAKIKAQLGSTINYTRFTTILRGVKTPEEMVLLKKSVVLSSLAHAEVMRAVRPEMSERELEGILLYVHKKYGAEDEGYPPIIGVGGNGCILHYEENSAMKLDNQLVLLDVGAEYHGYSADVTRTVPANGKFSEAQKAIYQLVYEAQEEVFKLCKAGTPYRDLEAKTGEVLAAGLIKLGIIKDASEVRKKVLPTRRITPS